MSARKKASRDLLFSLIWTVFAACVIVFIIVVAVVGCCSGDTCSSGPQPSPKSNSQPESIRKTT